MKIKKSDVIFWGFVILFGLLAWYFANYEMVEFFDKLDLYYTYSAILQGFAALLTLSLMTVIFYLGQTDNKMRCMREDLTRYMYDVLNYGEPIWNVDVILQKEEYIFTRHKKSVEIHSNEDEIEKELSDLDKDRDTFHKQLNEYKQLNKKGRMIKREIANPLILIAFIIIICVVHLPLGSFSQNSPEFSSSTVLFTMLISVLSVIWLVMLMLSLLVYEEYFV